MIGFRCRRGNKYMSDIHDDVYEDIYILRAISCGNWNMKDAKYSKMISKYSRRRSHLLTKDFWVTSKSVTWWKLWLIREFGQSAISTENKEKSDLGTEVGNGHYPSFCDLLVSSRKCLQMYKGIKEDRNLKCKCIHSYSVKNSTSGTFQNEWSDNPHWNISALLCTQNPQPRWVTVPGLREGQMAMASEYSNGHPNLITDWMCLSLKRSPSLPSHKFL